MQNANHIDSVFVLTVKNEMAPDRVASIALANFVASMPSLRVCGDALDRSPNLVDIDLGLARIPLILRKIPDRRKTTPGGTRQPAANLKPCARLSS